MDTPIKLFVATKAFIYNQNRVLLVRESAKYVDGSNPERWDVPGGRIEPGQRFDESLRREVKEETGLEVEIGSPFHVDEWRPQVRGEQWQIVGVFFECTSAGDTVTLGLDHNKYEWIDPKDYSKYNLTAGARSAFEALQKTKSQEDE